eukprot:m.48417 g.48417  ORF g.48417 m.48417 type:complete len:1123 (-) comp10568_c0_seq1:65-3433(-)
MDPAEPPATDKTDPPQRPAMTPAERAAAARAKRLARLDPKGSQKQASENKNKSETTSANTEVKSANSDGVKPMEVEAASKRVSVSSLDEDVRAKRLAAASRSNGNNTSNKNTDKPMEISSPKEKIVPATVNSKPAVHNVSPTKRSQSRTPSHEGKKLHEWALDTVEWVLVTRLRKGEASTATPSMISALSLASVSWMSAVTELEDVLPGLESEDYSERDLADRIIMGRLTTPRNDGDTALQYLLECFHRASQALKSIATTSPLHKFLTEAKSLAVSYSRIVLEDASNFDEALSPTHHLDYIASRLSKRAGTSEGLPSGYLQELLDFCGRLVDDGENFNTIFQPLLERIRHAAKDSTVLDAIVNPILALRDLTAQSSHFCTLILEHPLFLVPLRRGRDFESETLLGPFFCGTLIAEHPPSMRSVVFQQRNSFDGGSFYMPDDAGRHNPSVVENNHRTFRYTLDLIVNALHTVLRSLLKVKEHRSRVLDFLAMYLRENAKRSRTHGNRDAVVRDGTALTMGNVMLKLCDKFADCVNPNFHKIDVSYIFRENMRMQLKEDPLVPETGLSTPDWLATLPAPQEPNFITEIFFMTLHALHQGFMPCAQRYAYEWVGRHGRLVQIARAMRDSNNDQEKQRLQLLMNHHQAAKLCFDAELMNPAVLELHLRFYTFASLWLLAQADKNISFPFHSKVGMPYALLPEYYVSDFAELLLFISKFASDTIENCMFAKGLIKCILVFIDSYTHVVNPYIRAKFVEVLSTFSSSRRGRLSTFFDHVQSDPLAAAHLSPALMQFYVDAENTDFYQKLEMRYNTQVILKDLWKSPRSREGFIKASNDGEQFVRFVMLLINDTTFLLDDSREGLATIHSCKQDMASPSWNSRPEQEKEEIEKKLRSAEGQARASLQLVDETLNLFQTLTKDIVEPFLRQELVGRLAGMLNLNIVALVGPKASEVLVENPLEYGFDRLLLISRLADIYLNLSNINGTDIKRTFIDAIAADQRSYKHEILVLTHRTLSPERGTQFIKLMDVVKEASIRNAEEEIDVDDAPPEYLDPIMCDLMRDPVKLPSGTVIDRGTIMEHLLSDPSDPFNRSPLTSDMLVPATELKNEIEAWILEQRAKKGQEKSTSS